MESYRVNTISNNVHWGNKHRDTRNGGDIVAMCINESIEAPLGMHPMSRPKGKKTGHKFRNADSNHTTQITFPAAI